MGAVAQARESLLAERERLTGTIADLQSALQQVEGALTALGAPMKPRRRRRRTVAQRRRTGGRKREGTTTEAVETFLAGQGRKAVHADAILEHLGEAGRAPGGKNPKATLASTLRRLATQGRVRNVGRNRWRALRRAS